MNEDAFRQSVANDEHLRLLSWGFVVSGIMTGLFSLLGLLYAGIGLIMSRFFAEIAKNGQHAEQVPPEALGTIVGIFGGMFFLVAISLAVAKLWTARCINRRESRIFCLVVAGDHVLRDSVWHRAWRSCVSGARATERGRAIRRGQASAARRVAVKRTLRCLLMLAIAVSAGTHAEPDATTTRAEISVLLHALGASQCEFFRNGNWYDSAKAEDHPQAQARLFRAQRPAFNERYVHR